MKYPELMKKCLEKWGSDAQMFLFVEECGELLQAISKIRREDSADAHANLQEEVADMLIMLWQAIELYSLDDVQSIMNEKQERLFKRFKEWEKMEELESKK